MCCVQTDEDWKKVRSGKVGCDLDRAHYKLVTKEKSKFLAKLKNTGGYLYFSVKFIIQSNKLNLEFAS